MLGYGDTLPRHSDIKLTVSVTMYPITIGPHKPRQADKQFATLKMAPEKFGARSTNPAWVPTYTPAVKPVATVRKNTDKTLLSCVRARRTKAIACPK